MNFLLPLLIASLALASNDRPSKVECELALLQLQYEASVENPALSEALFDALNSIYDANPGISSSRVETAIQQAIRSDDSLVDVAEYARYSADELPAAYVMGLNSLNLLRHHGISLKFALRDFRLLGLERDIGAQILLGLLEVMKRPSYFARHPLVIENAQPDGSLQIQLNGQKGEMPPLFLIMMELEGSPEAVNILQALIETGADPLHSPEKGIDVPLVSAFRLGYRMAFFAFASASKVLEKFHKRGGSLLENISISTPTDLINTVISLGEHPNRESRFGRNALTIAKTLNQVKLLVRRGADVNFVPTKPVEHLDTVPLSHHILFNRWDIVNFLLDSGADPRKHPRVDYVKLLIDSKAPEDIRVRILGLLDAPL